MAPHAVSRTTNMKELSRTDISPTVGEEGEDEEDEEE